jgi:hypothetical protein
MQRAGFKLVDVITWRSDPVDVNFKAWAIIQLESTLGTQHPHVQAMRGQALSHPSVRRSGGRSIAESELASCFRCGEIRGYKDSPRDRRVLDSAHPVTTQLFYRSTLLAL